MEEEMVECTGGIVEERRRMVVRRKRRRGDSRKEGVEAS